MVIPERRAATVTAAVSAASAARWSTSPVAQVRNLADFLADAKQAGCWCYGAAAGVRRRIPLAGLFTGGVVLVLGAEGRACARGSRRRATSWSRCPCGGVSSLNVSAAAAAVLLYEILHARNPA